MKWQTLSGYGVFAIALGVCCLFLRKHCEERQQKHIIHGCGLVGAVTARSCVLWAFTQSVKAKPKKKNTRSSINIFTDMQLLIVMAKQQAKQKHSSHQKHLMTSHIILNITYYKRIYYRNIMFQNKTCSVSTFQNVFRKYILYTYFRMT